MSAKNILGYVGYYGPVINLIIFIFFIVSLYLNNSINLKILIFLILIQPISSIFNHYLKKIIKQPRPKKNKPINYLDKKTLSSKQYGMPSGHAQANALLVTLSYLSNIPNLILFIMVIFSILTIWQRYEYRMHTANQLIAGTLFGIIIAIIYWYLTISPEIKYTDKNKTKSN